MWQSTAADEVVTANKLRWTFSAIIALLMMITVFPAVRRVTVTMEPISVIPHLVKLGLFGHIGRFSAADGGRFERDQQVICRTGRGLEVGEVLCCLESEQRGETDDGLLLRKVSPDDRRIIERIDRFRDRAFTACQQLLNDRNLSAVLVDVEHLFDGQSIFFYFLGEVPKDVHYVTEQLVAEYEKKVQFRKFTKTLLNGCGPNCGTDAGGCQAGGCGNCSLKKGCGKSESVASRG